MEVALAVLLVVLLAIGAGVLVRDARRASSGQVARPSAATGSPKTPEPDATSATTEAPDGKSSAAQRREQDRAALKRARRLGCRGKVYKVGMQGPLTGEFAQLGQGMSNGVELALAQANRGTLLVPSERRLPRKLFLTLHRVDTKGMGVNAPGPSARAARKRNVLAIVGPAFSGEAMASGPIYESAGVPFVTPTATLSSLAGEGWSNFFRLVGDDEAQAAAAARYMVTEPDLNVKRVAVVDDGSDYGSFMADRVEAALQRRDVNIVSRLTVAPDSSRYRDEARQIVGARPDAVFFGGYYEPAGFLRRDLARAGGRKLDFITDDGSFDTGFVERAGPAADGAYALFPGTESTEIDQTFVEAYRSRYFESPPAFAFEYYVAATVLVDAILEKGCRRAAIRDHLDRFSGTIAGKKVAFRNNGEIAAPTFTVYRASGGGWHLADEVP